MAVFGRGMRGPAVAVTVVDDAVVQWLSGLDGRGLEALFTGRGPDGLLVAAVRAVVPGACGVGGLALAAPDRLAGRLLGRRRTYR